MKIPKVEKDRTLTRRTVKGAAGGLKGVHYEDDRRPDPATKRSPEAERIQKTKAEQIQASRHEAIAAARAMGAAAAAEPAEKTTAPKEEQEMILDDEDANSREAKAKQKRRAVVSRDRFTVDKDAPDRRRKVRWDLLSEEEEEALDEAEPDVDFEAIAAAVHLSKASRSHLFLPDDRPSPGAPGLLLPDEIYAAFGSPLDYAKHCMLLAESFAQTTGATRDEAVRYLTTLFLGLADVRFGRRALLAWGPDTGILDIYPLEVIELVLREHPAFLPRVRFGRWIAPELGDDPQFELTVTPELPLFLTVPEDVTVRGFAVKGGARPGYCFEPGPQRSTYALTLGLPGQYELLMSARDPTGDTLVDRIKVRVLGPVAGPPARPARDAHLVAGWPIPEIAPRFDPSDASEDTLQDTSGIIDPAELARRQRSDAMAGPKGEDADPFYALGQDAARAPLRTGVPAAPGLPGPVVPLEAPEDAKLSAAEAAVLRLALAAGATVADVQVEGAVPTDGEEITEVLPTWSDTSVEPAYEPADSAGTSADVVLNAAPEGAHPPSRLGIASTEAFAEAADAPPLDAPGSEMHPSVFEREPAPERKRAGPGANAPAAKAPVEARPARASRPAPDKPAVVPPAPFALTGAEIAAGPPTLPEVPSVPPASEDIDPVEVRTQTVPDAPAVVGRPMGVVSGTQAQVPGEGGPTARIDLVEDLVSDPAALTLKPEDPVDPPAAQKDEDRS